jgi:hypothetical protein
MNAKGWVALVAGAAMGACSSSEAGPTAPERDALAAASGPVVASASGSGRMVLEVFGFTIPQVLGFTAQQHADGSVSGHIEYRQTFEGETFQFVATVTCMEIYDGNRVKYGGVLTQSTDPTVPVGDFMWFQSIDNGEGQGSPADLSTGSGFGPEEENQAFCDSPDPPNPIFLAEVIGNIQVRD